MPLSRASRAQQQQQQQQQQPQPPSSAATRTRRSKAEAKATAQLAALLCQCDCVQQLDGLQSPFTWGCSPLTPQVCSTRLHRLHTTLLGTTALALTATSEHACWEAAA